MNSIINSGTVDALYSASNFSQAGYDSMANNALARGIDASTKGDYAGAIREFKSSIGFSPHSDYSLQTHEYLANAYLKQGKTENAIAVYRQAIRLFPMDDRSHLNLATILYQDGRYGEAEAEYKKAVAINPYSSVNRYGLGQAYLTSGRNLEAEKQLKMVITLAPDDPIAYDALGQVYTNLGRYKDAVTSFQKAIGLNEDYADAHLGLGYAYAKTGEIDEAGQQAALLHEMDSSKAIALENYIREVSAPKFIAAYSDSGFMPTNGPDTKVSSLDESLSASDTTKVFTMKFIFTKDMNASSVENPYNWQISRATGDKPGGAYNWGLAPSSTDASISSIPDNVTYDEDSWTATVDFGIAQNSAADGTIDPSHIIFKFSGIDAYGKAMDPSADEYSGFSSII